MRREAVGRVLDERGRALLEDLMSLPTTPQTLRSPPTSHNLATIPLGFKIGDSVLDLFSMITVVGTPQMVSSEEIRLETMFPLDDEGERYYPSFLGKSD